MNHRTRRFDAAMQSRNATTLARLSLLLPLLLPLSLLGTGAEWTPCAAVEAAAATAVATADGTTLARRHQRIRGADGVPEKVESLRRGLRRQARKRIQRTELPDSATRSLKELRGIAEEMLFPEDFIFLDKDKTVGGDHHKHPPKVPKEDTGGIHENKETQPPKTLPPKTEDEGGSDSDSNSNSSGDGSGDDISERLDENTEDESDESGSAPSPTAPPVSKPSPSPMASPTGTEAPFITAIIHSSKDEGRISENDSESTTGNGSKDGSSGGSDSGKDKDKDKETNTDGNVGGNGSKDGSSGGKDKETNTDSNIGGGAGGTDRPWSDTVKDEETNTDNNGGGSGGTDGPSKGGDSDRDKETDTDNTVDGGTTNGTTDSSSNNGGDSGKEDGTLPAGNGEDGTGGKEDGIGGTGGGEPVDETEDSYTDSDVEELICVSIAVQEPITSPEIEAQTVESSFAIGIDVLYNATIASSTGIQLFLTETNPAMAYWIAGCGIHPDNPHTSSDKNVRALRGLQQEEEWAPIVTYAELDPWSATGPCEGESESDASVCQEPFASLVRVRVQSLDDSRTSDYLRNQIDEAFETILKPLLEVQPGILGVELAGVREGVDREFPADEVVASDARAADDDDDRRRRTIILACSIVAAGVFMCALLLILIGLYRRRLKKAPARSSGRRSTVPDVAHVPFRDEIAGDEDDFDDDQDSLDRLVLDGYHDLSKHEEEATNDHLRNRAPSDEFVKDEDSADDYYDEPESAIPAIPCPYETEPPPSDCQAPFDENEKYHPSDERRYQVCSSATCQHCEQRRRLGIARYKRSVMIRSISSTEPPNVPMDITPNTITTPRFDRLPLSIDPDRSRRRYRHEDTIDL